MVSKDMRGTLPVDSAFGEQNGNCCFCRASA